MSGVTMQYTVDPVSEYVLGTPTRGGYRLRRGKVISEVRPGQLVVLDPSLAHSGTPAQEAPWHGQLLVLDSPVSRPAAASSLLAGEYHPPILDNQALVRRFLHLHAALVTEPEDPLVEASLLAFLDDIARLGRPTDRRKTLIAPGALAAAELLRSQYTRNITLDELARAADMSKFELVRRFREAHRHTPHAYLLTVRISRARQLLAEGMRPAEVAALVGFSDQSHLNRHFRARLGMTPGAFSRATRATPPEPQPAPLARDR
jgi:AraC-like DNA-binding protein